MYKLVYEFSPDSSNSLLVGILNLVKEDKVINQIQAASSYPGNQYSGSWRQKGGLIPPGDWQVASKPIEMDWIKGINADRVNLPSNFYQIFPEVQKQSNGVIRGDFGIHYDGNAPGSLGCICPRTAIGWKRTIDFMAEAAKVQRLIDLKVLYS